MAASNPFVYGEVVPRSAFVDREAEIDRLTRDLLAGQKVFLISPRRYGKSSLLRQALAETARRGALTAEITVSSYSSYVAFLEGYARALVSLESRAERALGWLRDRLGGIRPEVRLEPDAKGAAALMVSFPSARTPGDVSRLAVLSALGRLFRGTHLAHSAVETFDTHFLEIETSLEQPWICADGESLCQTPCRLEVRPQALRVVVDFPSGEIDTASMVTP